MERTESVVVQVAPQFENEKIAEMEHFGWNLQGRQEIHQPGDAYGAPSFFDSNTYVIKQHVSHYVKLHFVRSLNLPNLDRIKAIEEEYFNLPFPQPPAQKWSIGCIGLSMLYGACVLCALILGVTAERSTLDTPTIVALIVNGSMAGVGVLAGVFWYLDNNKKRREAMEVCQQSAQRAHELLTQARQLLE